MIDPYKGFSRGLTTPAEDAFEITPDDANELPCVTRAIYIGAAGDVRITTASGQTVTLKGATAGCMLSIRVGRVHATGTTAGELVGLY